MIMLSFSVAASVGVQNDSAQELHCIFVLSWVGQKGEAVDCTFISV